MEDIVFDRPKIPFLERIMDRDKYMKYFDELMNHPEKLEDEFLNGDSIRKGLQITDAEMKELYDSGHHYFEIGDYTNAADHFMCLALLNNTQPEYWLCFAHSCFYLEKYPEALKGYAVYALLNEQDPTPHYFGASCLRSMGQMKEAMDSYSAAIELAHGHPDYQEIEEDAIKAKEELESHIPSN